MVRFVGCKPRSKNNHTKGCSKTAKRGKEMNAFTQKPDLSKFFKDVKHSAHVAELGRKTNSNPTKEQKLFFNSKAQNLSSKNTRSAA